MEEIREPLTLKEPTLLQAQTGVECKLPVQMQGVGRILQLTARAVPQGTEALSGAAQYAGRVLFCVVYADAEGAVKKCECGVQFSGRAENSSVTPHSQLILSLTAENVRFRTAGETVYLSCVVGAEMLALTPREGSVLLSASGVILKQESRTFSAATALLQAEIELADEWEDAAVSDVLCYKTEAFIERVTPAVSAVAVEGTVRFFTLLKGDGIFCTEKTLPFRVELDAPAAMPNHTATLFATVGDVHFDIVTDPEKNASKTEVTYSLHISGALYEELSFTVAEDAFSPECDLIVQTETAYYLPEATTVSESVRVSGRTPLPLPVAENAKMLAAVPVFAQGEVVDGGGFSQVEGAICLSVFYAEGGAVKAQTVDFPLTVPLKMPTAENADCRLRLGVERVSADFVSGGELAVTAQVAAQITTYFSGECSYLSAVEEGEKKPKTESAVRICFAAEGSELWTLAKTLGVAPERITAANPDLTFPLKREERVLLLNFANRN